MSQGSAWGAFNKRVIRSERIAPGMCSKVSTISRRCSSRRIGAKGERGAKASTSERYWCGWGFILDKICRVFRKTSTLNLKELTWYSDLYPLRAHFNDPGIQLAGQAPSPFSSSKEDQPGYYYIRRCLLITYAELGFCTRLGKTRFTPGVSITQCRLRASPRTR